jgi:hypothetical protein
MLAIVLVFILLLVWLGPKVFCAIRGMLGQVGAMLRGAQATLSRPPS